jgi:hypothetical protein
MAYGIYNGHKATIHLPGYGDTAPSVPEASPIQTTLPTSAYGQTIPVVWGKARVPGAYIWVPPIITITSSHQEYWDTITTTNSPMSCRLRFARPLVPNSTWILRRLWSNGTLVYDASQNYRKKGLNFRFYDGKSTQGRDPTMTREEGTNNVSAHRGYIDIVLTDFDIQGYGSPPVFEAEVIQDGASTHVYEDFLTYSGSVSFGKLLPIWDQNKLLALDSGDLTIQLYSLPGARQYFSFSIHESFLNYFQSFRYSHALDRIVLFTSFAGNDFNGRSYDGTTGELRTVTSSTTGRVNGNCLVDMGQNALLISFTASAGVYVFKLITVDDVTDEISLVFDSGANWLGYSAMQCATLGEVRASEFDIYFCADADLLKATFFSTGLLKAQVVLASFSDDLYYAVYDGGDVVVWTDAATVKRVDGDTGSVAFTKSVPYQIPASSNDILNARSLLDPDLQNLTEELYFASGSNSYFTDLGTGVTRTVAGRTASLNGAYVYDGATNTVILKGAGSEPDRIRFVAGDGDSRLLADFLEDLMVYGGGYDPSDIVTENIDDAIQGAVVDITAGARDVARAVIEPYSIAMFER